MRDDPAAPQLVELAREKSQLLYEHHPHVGLDVESPRRRCAAGAEQEEENNRRGIIV